MREKGFYLSNNALMRKEPSKKAGTFKYQSVIPVITNLP